MMNGFSPAAIPHPVDGVLFLTVAMAAAGLAQVLWLRSGCSWRLAIPLDRGREWRGCRLLGDNKTVRGFVLMVPASALCFAAAAFLLDSHLQLWQLPIADYAQLGALAGLGFMAGELPNSFLKRRLGIPPGRLPRSISARRLVQTGDRLDSMLGMLLAMSLVVPTPLALWLLAIGVGVGVHGFFSHLLVRWGAKGPCRGRARPGSPLLFSLEGRCPESQTGAKAARLSVLKQNGFCVPPGVVLGAEALEQVLEAASLHPAIASALLGLDADDPASGEQVSHRVRTLIEAVRLPESIAEALSDALELIEGPLAVRSSALGEDSSTASFAGQLDSILDIDGAAALEAAVRRCWASRWSPRALSYQRSHRIQLAGVAVLVQSFVVGRLSGVLFTRDPADSGRMLAELCSGCGDALVGGRISPAQLRLDRAYMSAHWIDGGDETVELRRIADEAGLQSRLQEAGQHIEELFGSPQDIEWTLDSDNRLVILQSRPITTTGIATRIDWSSANIAENYPDPVTPFVASLARRSYRAYFETLGRALSVSRRRIDSIRTQLGRVVGTHGGRLYYNLTSIEEILAAAPCGEVLSRYFAAFVGTAASPRQGPPDGALRTIVDGTRMLLGSTGRFMTIRKRVALFEDTVVSFAERCHPDRLPEAEWAELRDLFDDFLDIRLRRWQGAGLADTAAMLTNGALRQLLRHYFAERHVSLHGSLLTGLTGLASGEPVLRLWELSRMARRDDQIRGLLHDSDRQEAWRRLQAEFPEFAAAVDAYLEAWGYRCSGELMLTVASFQERPGDLLEVLRGYLELEEPGPAEMVTAQARLRRRLTRSTARRLRSQRLSRWLPSMSPAPFFRGLLYLTQQSVALRERARLKQALLYSRCRRILLEIGRRLVAAGRMAEEADILWLRSEEVEELLGGGLLLRDHLGTLVEARRAAHRREAATDLPENLSTSVDGVLAATATVPEEIDASLQLAGVGACGGKALGRAALLKDMSQFSRLRAGDILVAPQTDPGWGPVFFMIGGLVLERGGTLSHGAIIAREFGIPAVVGVRGAFERIQPDCEIAVDGDTGRVAVVG